MFSAAAFEIRRGETKVEKYHTFELHGVSATTSNSAWLMAGGTGTKINLSIPDHNSEREGIGLYCNYSKWRGTVECLLLRQSLAAPGMRKEEPDQSLMRCIQSFSIPKIDYSKRAKTKQ